MEKVFECKFTIKTGEPPGTQNKKILTPEQVRMSNLKSYFYQGKENYECGDLVVVFCRTGYQVCQVVRRVFPWEKQLYNEAPLSNIIGKVNHDSPCTKGRVDQIYERMVTLQSQLEDLVGEYAPDDLVSILSKTDPAIRGRCVELEKLRRELNYLGY